MLSFPSFTFIFSLCKSSDLNSLSCSIFSQRKPPTSELHLPLCFLSPVLLSSCPLHFLVSPNFSHFFVFGIRLSFLSLCFRFGLLSSNLSIMPGFDNKPQEYFLINIFTNTTKFTITLTKICNLKISEDPYLY